MPGTEALDAAWDAAPDPQPSKDPLDATWDAAPAPTQPQPAEDRADSQAQRDTYLENILWNAGVGSNVERKAAVYQLSSESGIKQDIIEANYDAIATAWAGARMSRAHHLARPGQAAVPDEPYKAPGARFREANPELTKILLDNPALGWVSRVPELNVLARTWNAAADVFFTPVVNGKLHPDTAEEVAKFEKLQAQKEALLFNPKAGLYQADEVSKQLQDGWVTLPTAGQLGVDLPIPRRALVPVMRGIETWDGLQISKSYSELRQARIEGKDTTDLESKILDMEQRTVQRDYQEGPVEQIFTDAAQAVASSAEGFKEGGLVGGAFGAVAGGATLAVTRSPTAARAAGVRAMALGMKGGAVWATYEMESGDAYRQMLHARKPDGSAAMDEPTASLASEVYGMLAAGVEFASWGPMFKAMGPLGAMLKEGETKAFTEALIKNPTFMGELKRIGGNWAASAAAEGGEEFLQDATQQAVEYFARSHASGQFLASNEPELKQSFLAGAVGATGGAFMGGSEVAIDLMTQHVMADRSLAAGKTLRALANMPDNPVAQSAPDVVAKLFAEQTSKSGAPATHVYVDARSFVRLFQDEQADPDHAARLLLGDSGPQQLADAVQQRGKLVVPVEDYVNKWVPGEVAKRLVDDSTTSPALLTANEAAVAQPEIQRQAEEFAKALETGDQAKASTQIDQLEQAIVDSGRMTPREAKLAVEPMRAIVRTAADVFEQSAGSLFQHYSVLFGAGDEALSVTLGAPASSRHLTRVYQNMSPEEQVRAHFIDTTTGVLNRRAWERLKPEGRKAAVISVEGVKYSNDKSGHDAGNAVYRAAARALAPHAPELAKVGGDFALYVKDQAELNQVLERANASAELQGLRLVGSVGDTLGTAAKSNNARKQGLEEQKQRALRGARPISATGEFSGGGEKLQGTKVSEHLRQAFTGMKTEAERFNEAFTEQSTGLLNKDGFEAAPAAKYQLTMDFDGIKELNRLLGEEQVDQLLGLIGNKLRELRAHEVTGAHISGDEYQGKHDDKALLEYWAKRAQEFMARLPVPVTLTESEAARLGLESTEATLVGLPFSYGVGQNVDDAEHALLTQKQERLAAGLRGEGSAARRLVGRAEGSASARGPAGEAAPGPDQVAGAPAVGSAPLGPDFGRQRYFDTARLEQPVGQTRLEQFPTPEQSLENASVARALQDALQEQGLSEVDAKKISTGKVVQRLRKAAKLVEFLGITDPLELQTPQEVHDALDDRMEYMDLPERAVAWDMVRAVGGPEGLLAYMRAALGAEDFNLTANREARRPPGQTKGPRSDAYAHFGGSTAESWDHELMLELDNENLTAGPGSAEIPASKNLPGQAGAESATRTGLSSLLKEAGVELPRLVLRLEQMSRLEAPSDKGVPRGYTDVVRTGLERVFRIALNKNADLSTFLHESGHVFLEIFADLAERPDAPARVKEDWAHTLKYLGAANRQGITRDMHEKWARSFEAYLLEGKAPSPKLVASFERFKLWLKKVYRDVKALNVELNDEIRGVFDRLLATDAELHRQSRRMGLEKPVAQDVLQLSDEEYAAYLEDWKERLQKTQQQIDLRALKDRLRENEAWWKQEYAKELADARDAYEQLPGRRAQQTLAGKGEIWGANGPSIALRTSQVVAAVGEKASKKFLTAKDGVNPDEVADFLNYPTGTHMLSDILDLPDKPTWSKQRAEEQMRTKYPDVLDDRSKLRELVAKGLHGDMTERWLLEQRQELKRKMSVPGTPIWAGQVAPVEALKLAAKRAAERTKVSQLSPARALQQERAAADRQVVAAAKGQYGEAFVANQEQLINMYLWRELEQAKEERDKLLELAGDLTKDKARARLGKARPVYRNFVDSLLEALKLKEPDENNPGAGIDEVVRQMDADGQTIGVDEDALARILISPRGFKDLTLGQMRAVSTALNSVLAAARGVNTAILNGKRVDVEELELRLLDEAPTNLPPLGPIASSESAEGPRRSVMNFVAGLDGSLLRPELMLKWMGDLWVRAFVDPLQQAKHREADILKSHIRPIVAAFEKAAAAVKGRFMEKVDGRALFPQHQVAFDQDLEPPTRRFELLMMALNAGNESNLVRLLEGRNISHEQLLKAFELLTKEELDWVQSVWDASEALWPLAAELEERDSGLRPEKLELRPLVTKHGTYKGGYFPAVYDRRVEAVGERQASRTVADLMDQNYTRPGTSRSHLKSRVDGFTGVISLEPGTISRMLGQVAHDIAYREAVKSVGNLVMRPALQAELKRRLGQDRAEQFLQWVKDVGQMRGLDGAIKTKRWMKIVQKLRGNTIVAVLGYSASTAAGDLGNLFAAVPRSGLEVKHWAAGLMEFMVRPFEATAAADAKSGELRFRRDHLVRELGKQSRELTSNHAVPLRAFRWIKDHAFAFMEFSDLITTRPVWMGAYRQAVAKGLSEAESVRFADGVIREVFPSHAAVDLPGILRDKGFWGASMMFYGYFSVVYNSIRDIVHPLHTAADGVELAKRIPKVSGRLLAFMSAAVVLSELLSGRGPEDEEDWASWYMRKLLVGGLSSLPVAGDVATYYESKKLGKHVNPRQSPMMSIATQLGDGALKLSDEDTEDEKKAKVLMQTLAPPLGFPMSQPMRTGGGVLMQAEDPARNPFELGSDLMYGRREGQPKNPLSIAGEAVAGSPR